MGCRGETITTTSHHCSLLHGVTPTADFAQLLNDYITSDDVLETEDARTEYGLPKIWVKLAHAYTADTRLSSSSPPRSLGEPVNEATHINTLSLKAWIMT